MRLVPRLAAAITVLALVVAGCGGANVAYREVPGGPVPLEVPGNGEGVVSAATPTPTADADATPTPAADAAADATPAPEETPVPQAGDGTAEGGTEAPAEEPPADTAPSTDTPPEGLDDYCAANPGAC